MCDIWIGSEWKHSVKLMLVKNKGLTHKNFILISSTMCSLLLYNLDACLLSIIFRVFKVYQLLTVRCKVNVKFERIFFFQIWGQTLFRGQHWGQTNFWSQAKNFLEPTLEPKFRPRQLRGQAKQKWSGQVLWFSMT